MNKFSIEFENCLENRICKLTEKSKPIHIALFQFNQMTNRFIIYIIMNTMKKLSAFTVFAAALLFFAIGAAYSQEALKSTEEEYFDFLSLLELTERPALNYRTLSDSVWAIKEPDTGNTTAEGSDTEANADSKAETINRPEKTPHPWQNNNLGTKKTLWKSNSENTNWFTNGLNRSVALKIYGPEWFNSYNTAAPYGQNDGALWQGKGYNTSLTAGVRLEAYGFEVTVKPQVAFSQNLGFEIMESNYDSKYGYFWGYGHNIGADAPQRFGDSSFWTFDWGDTEIRWSWHTFTIGFGTQSIWLGPAYLNPLLHSNNAATYPKFDIGLRRTKVHLPWLGWYIGDIEGRIWTGYLSESDYFDNDNSNNHNMFHGLSCSYSPSFIPGLTLGLNRTCLVKWNLKNISYVIPKIKNTHIGEQGAGEDQKMSITVDWHFPKIGFEVYGEVGLDDGTPFSNYLRSATHMIGLKKTITFNKKHNIFGEIFFEWSNTEMTHDFQFQWPYSFGFHYQITQGYTNKGQWLGSGMGYGGESRLIGFKLYHNFGYIHLFHEFANIDCNYIYSKAINSIPSDNILNGEWPIRYYEIFGLENLNFINKKIILSESIYYNNIRHYLYRNHTSIDNFTFCLKLKYNI